MGRQGQCGFIQSAFGISSYWLPSLSSLCRRMISETMLDLAAYLRHFYCSWLTNPPIVIQLLSAGFLKWLLWRILLDSSIVIETKQTKTVVNFLQLPFLTNKFDIFLQTWYFLQTWQLTKFDKMLQKRNQVAICHNCLLQACSHKSMIQPSEMRRGYRKLPLDGVPDWNLFNIAPYVLVESQLCKGILWKQNS